MTSVEKLLEDLPKDADTLRHVQEWVNSAVTDETDGAESEDQRDHHRDRDWRSSSLPVEERWAQKGADSSHQNAPRSHHETERHYRKRPTADYSGPPHPKRPRIGQGDKAGTGSVSATVVSGMGLPSSSAAPFDPASLVQSREGTFTPPDPIVKYLEKHFKHCLSKQEREALFKEHPRPDTAVCVVPRVDKYITDFLGRRMPKDRDAELMKIQAAVLAIARPLTSSWQKLQETEAEDGEEILVPATEVLGMIQRTLCLVGNASEYISQTRRTNILEAIDPSWSSYAAEEFPGARDSLFGEAFQVNLTERVEKDTALAKAVSITKKQKKESNHSFTPRGNPGDDRFFRRGPPARYGGRQGKNAIPYNQYHHTDRADTDQRRFQYTKGAQRSQSQFHQPRFPPGQTATQRARPQQKRY